MGSCPSTPVEGDLVIPDHPEATDSVSSLSDESISTGTLTLPTTKTPKKYKSIQAEQSVSPPDFVTAEQQTLWSTFAGPRCTLDISGIGAWDIDALHEYPTAFEVLATQDTTINRIILDNKARPFAGTTVDPTEPKTSHNLIASSRKIITPVTLPEECMECPTSGSEPTFVSDYTSVRDSSPRPQSLATHVVAPLEKLALAVFKFWPAGVANYLNHTTPSQSSGDVGSAETLRNFPQGSGQSGKTFNKSGSTNLPEKDERSSQNLKLSRRIKRNIAKETPVAQERCPVEAGHDDESCFGITHFRDIPRHLKTHHAEIYKDTLYYGRTLAQHITDLKMKLKQSSEVAREVFAVTLFTIMNPNKSIPYLRFDQLPGGGRRAHPLPTALALPILLPPSPSMQGTSSISVEDQQAQTPRPISPCSSHNETVTGRRSSDQPDVKTREQVAALNFAAEMKTDPLFAIRVQRIADELDTHQRDAQLQRVNIEFQLSSKRKELEADISATSSSYDQPAKRSRYSTSHTEAVARLKVIDAGLRKRYDEAEQKMRDLYDGRHRGGGSFVPSESDTQKQKSVDSGTQLMDAIASNSDHIGSHDLAPLPDLDVSYQDLLNEYDNLFEW